MKSTQMSPVLFSLSLSKMMGIDLKVSLIAAITNLNIPLLSCEQL